MNAPDHLKLGFAVPIFANPGVVDVRTPSFVQLAWEPILRAVHEHVRENLVCSSQVGATHWDSKRHRGDLPGAAPTFFFAPMQIAKRDEAPANLMQEVEGCIRARLEQGEVRIEDVAQSLGLSVRTLQSRLEGTGLNYRQVVDRVRHTLALAYLGDMNVSLVDVSAMLGFASQSSFNRAFMRWAGMAPGEYRRTKVQGEAPASVSRRRPPGG